MKQSTKDNIANNVNLCESCKYEIATCEGKNLVFGDDTGNDNVCACHAYCLDMKSDIVK